MSPILRLMERGPKGIAIGKIRETPLKWDYISCIISTPGGGKVVILHAEIKGYKSLRDVKIDFKPLTVIVGPNAAGKSNLFDALRLLSNIVTSRSLADAFRDHRGDPIEAFDYAESGIEGLLKKEKATFTLEVLVRLDDRVINDTTNLIRMYGESKKITHKHLRYRIKISIIPKTGILRVEDELLEAVVYDEKERKWRRKKRVKPFIEKREGYLILRMERQSRPMKYEVGLPYSLVSQPVYPPHYPHLTAFREELSRWQFYYLDPRVMREESPIKEVHRISSSGEDLAAFYYRLKINNPRQFENIHKSLKMIIPSIDSIDVKLTPEGKLKLEIIENGIKFSAKVVSEGTLRVLGLMAILSPLNPATLVGFEEPENGVHPKRLKLIAEMLINASEHKQIIINTHSPLLPDYIPEEKASLIICTKRLGHTTFSTPVIPGSLWRRSEVMKALNAERGSE